MTDENDSGIDRRKLLKRVGSVGAASGLGAAASQPVSANIKEPDPGDGGYGGGSTYSPYDQPDWYATHGNVLPVPEEDGNVGFDGVFPGDGRGGYGIKREESEASYYNNSWEDGPSSGDEVVVWAHGWQNGGLSIFSDGGSADEAVINGMVQCDLAWDSIEYEADDGFVDSIDHKIGWAWNSRSATANFRGAVGQAHRIGPKYYSSFLMDLADRISPGGTLHLGAHSLGAWMTLEGLAEVYIQEDTSGSVASVLDTVRFICGAVPSSAVGGDGGNSGWTNLEGYWSSGPYSPTYDMNALRLPNKVINGYFPCDSVLSTTCCDEDPTWWKVALGSIFGGFGTLAGGLWAMKDAAECGPFRTYMKNFHEGSASEAIGTRPKVCSMDSGAADWTNKEMTAVESHTGSYKHPDAKSGGYDKDPTGGGQRAIWPSSLSGSDVYGRNNCGGGGGGDYGGSIGGGGGDDRIRRREDSVRLR